MKKSLSRVVSVLLLLSMVLSFLPAASTRVHAVTQDQQNIVDRANYLYDLTWVAQETISGWRYQYTFEKGGTYRLPYAQPIYAGYYIGYGVSIEDFLAAAADGTSVFYTEMSTYNGWDSTYYGTDCSAYVSWCWGATRHTTYSIPQISTSYGMATESNIRSYLQLGDALNSNSAGHVVLVTDITYDSTGTMTQIEITEQTPPQLKRSYYTPAELAEKYQEAYDICRYNSSVPAAPVVSYISKCTSYAAHCVVEVTADAAVMSLPCGTAVDSKSTQVTTAVAGDTVTAIGLYENTEGELWYQLTTEDGQTGYLPADATVYQTQITDDITVTGADSPNGHVQGDIFYVTGTISAQYNQLTTAAVYIYEGFGREGEQVTGYSDTVSGNSYTLKGSNIDNKTAFDQVGIGENTYVIWAQYQNHYVADGVVQTNSGTKYLMEDYFVCVPSAVDQSSCAHSYSDTTLVEADCVTDGAVVHACLTCGYVYEETIAAAGHSYGDWEVVTAAGCTTEGTQTQTCGACGEVQTQIIPAAGHGYTATVVDSTCVDYSHTEYICGTCGHSYKAYDTMSDWAETVPEGVAQDQLLTKLQYRHRDYETVLSREETLEGYEQLGSAWVAEEQGEVVYVPSWPSGFDTTSDIYAEYDNADAKVTAIDDGTARITVESDARVGYLYYHWCSSSDTNHYSYAQRSSTHNIFHAYYSETAPSNYKCDTSDMSYQTADSTCASGNSQWFFVNDVYAQKYTTYAREYSYGCWGDWSDWSDELVEGSDTRQVETRTLYSWPTGQFGDHSFMDGVCTLCGQVQEVSYYLFGWIEDQNYGCEENADQLGQYGFTGGRLVATFASTCYVGVKTADNALWYMTDGWQEGATSVTLYPTDQLETPDKLLVPGGVQVTFTLTENEDGTLTLSYETAPCTHDSHGTDGSCTKCGQAVDHSYETVTTEPACTTEGTIVHTCTVCGHSETETLPALGHSYETVTEDPTCTTDGTATHTCTVCGHNEMETLPALGHSYETVTEEPTCTADGTATHTCTVCGHSQMETLPALGHSYETVTVEPTCTADGSVTQTCTVCGDSVTQTLAAVGHDDTAVVVDSTCVEYAHTEYICGTCGRSYKEFTMSDWTESLPEGVAEVQLLTKLQYRYRDYETVLSREETLEGYEQLESAWVAEGNGEVVYVPSWPSGFDTTSDIYAEYDNADAKVTAVDDETAKLTVESDARVGYLYYHWCSSSDANHYSYAQKSSTHNIFHAYYSETAPSNYKCDTSDMSYQTADSTCANGNSQWFFVTDVYAQEYTTYTKEYTYGGWGQWSQWSDEVMEATDTRQVETRTLYSYPTGDLGDHQWDGAVCSLCGKTRVLDYYLFGYINGANYACEEDYSNMGQYKFVDGQLTATFTEDSYVAVKTTDNAIWYMSEGYIEGAKSVRLYDTADGLAYPDKLKVPGGVEVTFTLVVNDDGSLTLSYVCQHAHAGQVTTEATCTTEGTLTYTCPCGDSYTETIPAAGHSYADGVCTVCGAADPDAVVDPGLNLKYPSLSFEDEIFYNVYFTVSDMTSVEEMGLMLLSSRQTDATIDDAIGLVPGYQTNGTMYMVKSEGIAAAYMGDTMYFKIYAKLTDGSYAYSTAGGYNAKAYANTVLSGDYTDEMKSLVVAMVSYGAEAQLYFDNNTDALVNAALTDDQKALVDAYDETMVDAVVTADSSKTANFVRVSSNFSSLYPSVSFDSAFSINFYCTPAITVDSGMTLYYWDAETYNSITEFTVDNATGSMEMTVNNGQYWGNVPGIAAKDMDKTYYVSCVFESEGETVTTGIIAYSLGKYCEGKAATDGDAQQTFAQATAVYGYYAKQYFASIA